MRKYLILFYAIVKGEWHSEIIDVEYYNEAITYGRDERFALSKADANRNRVSQLFKKNLFNWRNQMNILIGVLVPFFGTAIGSACVFMLKGHLNEMLQKGMLGFAAGVMVAASVWSLIMPSINLSEKMGRYAFLPALVGIVAGMAFLLAMDQIMPCMQNRLKASNSLTEGSKKTAMLVFAVTLHNIPEGIAVGVVFAELLSGQNLIAFAGAMALSVGIAIQNVPEGAIVAMPLQADGCKRGKAFLYGVLSGIVEPCAAGLTILFADVMTPLLPYLLTFAAGAMIYVVVEELTPEACGKKDSYFGTIGFGAGFIVMMALDVALG